MMSVAPPVGTRFTYGPSPAGDGDFKLLGMDDAALQRVRESGAFGA